MYEYLLSEEAAFDLLMAERAYLDYFSRIGEKNKGIHWAHDFFQAYRAEIDNLKVDPYRHPFCRVYPFNQIETRYRSFTAGWFRVFYTVEADSFTVWAVRSTKSDFSQIPPT